MPFLRNPHLDLTTSRIETARCVIVPFSTDGRVDIRELGEEFCKANKNLYVSPFLPNYEEEMEFVTKMIELIVQREVFENVIIEKDTNKLIGAIALNSPEENTMNIGLWIREGEQEK